jgi:hypothetical protein
MEPDFPPAGHIALHIRETGTHPATSAPLLTGVTCGSCVHRVVRQLRGGDERTKCDLATARRGGPNIQPQYTACARFEGAT